MLFRALLVGILCTAAPVVALAQIYGDTNGDGAIYLDDYNNVRNNFGGSGGVEHIPLGDTNFDYVVNLIDSGNVRNNYGLGNAPASIGVPSALGVKLSLAAVAAYDASTIEPRELPDLSLTNGSASGLILRIDVSLQVVSIDALDLGLANVEFDIDFGSSAVNPFPNLGWNATATPTIDSNGPASGGNAPLVADNADLANPVDLENILVGVGFPLTTDPAIDPRWRFSQEAAYNAGSIYVQWDGVTPTSIVASIDGMSGLRLDGSDRGVAVLVDGFAISGGLSLGGGAVPLEGDFNADGVVDAADYTVLRDRGPQWHGDVRAPVFDLWAANYSAGGTASQPNAVPEPAGMTTLFAAIAAAVGGRYRRG